MVDWWMVILLANTQLVLVGVLCPGCNARSRTARVQHDPTLYCCWALTLLADC